MDKGNVQVTESFMPSLLLIIFSILSHAALYRKSYKKFKCLWYEQHYVSILGLSCAMVVIYLSHSVTNNTYQKTVFVHLHQNSKYHIHTYIENL